MALSVGTNTWVTLSELNSYLATSVRGMGFSASTDAVKEAVLVTAYRALNRKVWKGEATTSSAFPRTGLVDKYGDEVSSATVPQDIKDAQCELAIELLLSAALEGAGPGGPNANIKSLQAGSASVSYFSPSGAYTSIFPPNVMELIAPYLSGVGTSTAGGSAFGVDGESIFTDCERYDFNGGGLS